MPIEIRELIIKTEISSKNEQSDTKEISNRELFVLKRQILEECKRMIAEKSKKNNNKR